MKNSTYPVYCLRYCLQKLTSIVYSWLVSGNSISGIVLVEATDARALSCNGKLWLFWPSVENNNKLFRDCIKWSRKVFKIILKNPTFYKYVSNFRSKNEL